MPLSVPWSTFFFLEPALRQELHPGVMASCNMVTPCYKPGEIDGDHQGRFNDVDMMLQGSRWCCKGKELWCEVSIPVPPRITHGELQ